MAKRFSEILPNYRAFIERQRVFFVASAAPGTRVNVSPKDGAALRVLDSNSVAYLDGTGSGNETSAHLLADGRLTIMLCAFEGPPLILRLYGRGRILSRGSAAYRQMLTERYGDEQPGARHMVLLEVDLVQASCGYGVPLFDYVAERPILNQLAKERGEVGMAEYRRQHNLVSLDGHPTGFVERAAETAAAK